MAIKKIKGKSIETILDKERYEGSTLARIAHINWLIEQVNQEFTTGGIQEAADADPNTTTGIRFYDNNGRQLIINSNGIATGDIENPFSFGTSGAYAFQYVDPNGRIKPYKSWVAAMSQSGTGVPATTRVFENNVGGTITFARTSVGLYTGVIPSTYTGTHYTTHNILSTDNTAPLFTQFTAIDNTISISVRNAAGVLTDGWSGTVELRIYE